MMKSWKKRFNRLTGPLLDLLRQGASPTRLALSFSLGAVIGLFPIVGITTAVCAVLAILFRLNLPTIQLANYMVYPLQLALLLPFAHLGAALFQAPPPPFSAGELASLLSEDLWGTIASFSTIIVHAVAAWLSAAPVVLGVTFAATALLFRRIARARRNRGPSSEIGLPDAKMGTGRGPGAVCDRG